MSITDYEEFSTSLTLPVNSENGTVQCFNVTIIDDNLVEGDKMLILMQSLVTTGLGVTLGNDTSTTITIIDNESKPHIPV